MISKRENREERLVGKFLSIVNENDLQHFFNDYTSPRFVRGRDPAMNTVARIAMSRFRFISLLRIVHALVPRLMLGFSALHQIPQIQSRCL